jgi:hypothetical protein
MAVSPVWKLESAWRSAAITGVVLAMTLGTVIVPSTAAAASVPQTNNAAKAAAGWLAREFTDKQRIEEFFDGAPGDFPDRTADAVLDFDAAGVAQEYARNATAWLAEPTVLHAFLTGLDGGRSAVPAHAQIILVAQAQGVDPASFGGVDVVGELRAMVASSGEFPGDDVANQALAITALHGAGGAPRSAVQALLGQQCADGGFAPVFDRPAGSNLCDDSEPLATPYAIQALLTIGHHRAAVRRALDWLQARQDSDGAFRFMDDDSMTGSAAAALLAGGHHAAAHKAIVFLKSLQAGCASDPVDRGGLAPSPGAAVRSGTSFNADTTIRATINAIPALAHADTADVSAEGARQKAPELRCVTTG